MILKDFLNKSRSVRQMGTRAGLRRGSVVTPTVSTEIRASDQMVCNSAFIQIAIAYFGFNQNTFSARRILPLLFVFLISGSELSGYESLFRVQGHFSSMKVDDKDKVFLLSGNTIHVYNAYGHHIAAQQFSQGVPMSLELSDENEIYLFFKESNEVQITDNNLAGRRTISLAKSGIESPGPACYAGMGRMWVYDRDREQFFLLDHNLEVRRESESLSNFAFHTLNPLSVTIYNDRLFVNNDGHEVLVFNRFGNYMNRLDVRTEGHLQIANGKIYFVRNARAHIMDIESGRAEQPALPFNFATVREFLIKNNKMYMLSPGGLNVFQM